MKRYIIIALLVIMTGSMCGADALQIVSGGAAAGRSASYRLIGIIRDRQLNVIHGVKYAFGEGFLRCIYFSKPAFAPLVTGISPASAPNTGRTGMITITGANFVAGASVRLSRSGETDIVADSVAVLDPGRITCYFELAGVEPGRWDVTVINPDSRSGALTSGFTVMALAPAVISITPNRGYDNETVKPSISGSNFRKGANARLSRAGENDILGQSVAVISPNGLSASFDLNGGKVGYWDVVVANNDGQYGVLRSAFKIESTELRIIGPVQFISKENPSLPALKGITMRYVLSRDAELTLYIFNIRGERIWSAVYPAGTAGGSVDSNEIAWDGRTSFNAIAPSGAYIIYFTGKVEGRQIILAKEKFGIIK